MLRKLQEEIIAAYDKDEILNNRLDKEQVDHGLSVDIEGDKILVRFDAEIPGKTENTIKFPVAHRFEFGSIKMNETNQIVTIVIDVVVVFNLDKDNGNEAYQYQNLLEFMNIFIDQTMEIVRVGSLLSHLAQRV